MPALIEVIANDRMGRKGECLTYESGGRLSCLHLWPSVATWRADSPRCLLLPPCAFAPPTPLSLPVATHSSR